MSKKALPRLPEDPTALSVAELDALESDAVKAAQDILADDPADDADKADAQLAELEELNKVVEGVRAEKSSRDEAAGKASRREELAAAFTVSDDADDSESDDADEDDDDDEPEASADGDEDTDDADGEEPADESKEQPVTAAARGPRVAQVAKRSKAPEAPVAHTPETSVVAAADVPGTSAGQAFENWNSVAEAVLRRTQAYSNLGPRQYVRNGVFSIRREADPELTVNGIGDNSAMEVIKRATDEKRLKGGSLVAAAAWCAPVETIYQPFGIPISMDGMLDLPTITVNRGGFQFTTGPDWSTLSAGTGEDGTGPALAQGWQGGYEDFGPGANPPASDTAKPCVTIECPEFTPVYLEVDGLCVKSNILTQQSYPELLADFLRQLPAAHAHIMNRLKIARLVDGSTAVDLSGTIAGATDHGTTGILAAMELAVEDLRYRYRLPFSATVEVVLPHWTLPVLRADLSRRNGSDLMSVTDQQIAAFFAARGARLQFVYDWQDASDGLAGGLGGATPSTNFPGSSFKALVYTAGTWVAAGNNILTVDSLYDSTNLANNVFTALWTEESWLVAKVGGVSEVVTVDYAACGLTGAQGVCGENAAA